MTSPAPRRTAPDAAAAKDAAVAPDDGSHTAPHGDPLSEPPAEVVDATEVEDPDEADAPEVPASDAEPAAAAVDYLALAQRTQADFENFRRRAARDAAVAADRGVGKLARELLPALDHLELALQAAESDSDQAHAEWAKGIRLIQSEFIAALARVGVQPFAPQGEPFDPAEHEAMAEQPAEGVESGTVVTVYQQGYRHNGQVLRPARVIVAA